jgi:hypothetical protein
VRTLRRDAPHFCEATTMTHVPATMIQDAAGVAARELLAGQATIELPTETLRVAVGMIAMHLPSQDRRMIEAAVGQEFGARLAHPPARAR